MALPVAVQSVLLLCTFFIISTDGVVVKWCFDPASTEPCKDSAVDDKIQYVEAPNIYRCMEMAKEGTVDVVLVSDTQLYAAGKLGLKPLLQVVHNNSVDYRYKAVAVVKANGKIKKLADLKNGKSCHTGAGKTTGWTVPVSNLIQMKILPTSKNCYSSTENVGDFFMESCVPGAQEKRYNPLGGNPPRLCALCHSNCSSNDEYAGYDGAKKCLESTSADIAFVKHDTMLNSDKKKYKLLCPNDQLMELDKYHDCNWAVRPSDTIVVSPKKSDMPSISNTLKQIISNLKCSYKWNNVEKLQDTNKDYSEILGKGFKNTFEYYHNCKDSLRWCVISDKELQKCNDLKLAFMAKRATNKLECVKVKDHYECMTAIERNKADFVVLDGGDISTAINNCQLEPVIAEDYGIETASYFAVAVVKKNKGNFNIKQLKGKKSCHTGIGKTSGWKAPISYLIKNKLLEKGHSIPEEVGEFFTASCVPGALDPKYNPHKHNPKSLCALCPKNGTDCQRNSQNIYYDYSGAFRCLVETSADVAFVKHTTVLESTDGNGDADWEANLKSDDYELLCKDGSRKPVSKWNECHLAKVPAHAIVVRKGNKDFAELLFRVFANFDLSNSESRNLLFTSGKDKNLLFKDSTKNLLWIEDPQKYFSNDYLEILKVFGSKLNVCSGSSRTSMALILVLFTFLNYLA